MRYAAPDNLLFDFEKPERGFVRIRARAAPRLAVTRSYDHALAESHRELAAFLTVAAAGGRSVDGFEVALKVQLVVAVVPTGGKAASGVTIQRVKGNSYH